MGAVRFDVHDILSFPDLDQEAREYFENSGSRRHSIRPGPALIIHLAQRGHWIQVLKPDIDDKSKADTVQKTLVVIQVLWMVVQCIARSISDLPLSLLEVHTMVHVTCAVLLYACWFEKPLDIQEAIIIHPKGFQGELAAMLQRELYSHMSYKLALFPPKQQDDQTPPISTNGQPMRWIMPEPQTAMKVGDILPSGLALSAAHLARAELKISPWSYFADKRLDPSTFSFELTNEFLKRWDAILATYPFERRDQLAKESKKLRMATERDLLSSQRGNSYPLSEDQQTLFLARLDELENRPVTDWDKPFWEKKSILHVSDEVHQAIPDSNNVKSDVTIMSGSLVLLAIALTSLYGGVHLTAWQWEFPSYAEEIMWKVSCFLIISELPTLLLLVLAGIFLLSISNDLGGLIHGNMPKKWQSYWESGERLLYWGFSMCTGLVFYLLALGYAFARVFIIVESFISLRHAPVGVFLSPEWVELFPHF
ncbi:hypothetical protein NW762_013990 [Fusarium torreyae]|uniref:Uncharacterized protein n=1 Tax=Fusarium torreyae TaxID=1237075 RepID=A0A9W8RMH4_9HYPO|nr:hypothetical protein NW762_013990 [Fusarium torreyae]